jgi:hypothetical protein
MIEKATITKDISSAVKKEFHFSGSGKYIPMTISAVNREEAEKIWLETRQEVGKQEKVEEINQENNQ